MVGEIYYHRVALFKDRMVCHGQDGPVSQVLRHSKGWGNRFTFSSVSAVRGRVSRSQACSQPSYCLASAAANSGKEIES